MPGSSSPSSPPAPARTWRLGAIAIALIAMIAYLPALNAGFIWDDDDYLTANPHVQSPGGLVRVWSPGVTQQYYPVVFTTFWIEHNLWGLDPLGYHVVNILLHAASAVVLWRLLTMIGVPGAWLIAAVFAVHPVHVESVAWVTERKNVLSGLLYLLAAFAYLRFDGIRLGSVASADRKRAWPLYTLALGLFTLAVLSKSVTCSLPAALILVLFYRRERLGVAQLAPLLPLFAIGFAAALHTAYLERANVGAIGEAFDLSMLTRTHVAARSLLFYPLKIIAPLPLMFVYPRWTITDDASIWPWLVVIAVAAAVVVLAVRGRRGPFVALAFYAGTVFPAIGFLNVYPHKYSFVADHFQYLASIGLIALVIGGLATLITAWLPPPGVAEPRRIAPPTVLLLLALMILTWRQATTYASAETVWRDTLAKNDEAWLAHNNLSTILLRRAERLALGGHPEAADRVAREAAQHAVRVTELHEDDHLARSNLSEALRLQGLTAEALVEQQRAVDIVAARVEAAGVPPPGFLARGYYQLGRLHHLLDTPDAAVAAYREALAIQPDESVVRRELANVLVASERYDEAEVEFRRIVAGTPDDAAALASAAALAERRADYATAAADLHAAVAAARTLAEQVAMTTRLIRLLSTGPDPEHRDHEEAMRLAEGLADLSQRRDPAALDVLASVYAAAGRREDAIATAQTALDLARRAGFDALARDLETRLAGYRGE